MKLYPQAEINNKLKVVDTVVMKFYEKIFFSFSTSRGRILVVLEGFMKGVLNSLKNRKRGNLNESI